MLANFLSWPRQRALVLGTLQAAGPMSGAEIARATGIMSGHLYCILIDLEDALRIQSDWEPGLDASPRRRIYSLPNGTTPAASAESNGLKPAEAEQNSKGE